MSDTKETILSVSLNLFAQKGFDGVSVREIAKEVGVRESALYKHFKNKQEILIKITEQMSQKIREAYLQLKVPETQSSQTADISNQYKNLTGEPLCNLVWNIFQLFTGNTELAKFRRLLMREQFNNSDFSKCYNNFFLSGVIESQSKTFLQLIKGGLFKEEDEEIVALHFYGPILFLFQQYDCCPQKADQIKEMLSKHVITFGNLYTK